MQKQTRTALCRMDSAWKKTPEGYLDALVYPTKAGVFKYMNADGTVRRELRPREEVFDQAHLDSLINQPTTNSHPPVLLDVTNCVKYGTGHTYGPHTVAEDNLHTQTRVLVKDPDHIKDIESGKEEVSLGYICLIEETSGVDPEFGPYDFIQRMLRDNHLASEWRGRAGSGARLRADSSEIQTRFDAWEITDETPETDPQDPPETNAQIKKDIKEKESSQMDKIRIDGKEYTNAEAAQIALDHKIKADAEAITTAKAEASTQQARADKAQAEADAAQAKLDAALAEVDQLKNRDISAMVKSRAALETNAAKYVKDAKFDGMSDQEIKQTVVKSVHTWAKLDGQSDDYVNALYESAIQTPVATASPVMDAYDSAQPRADFWEQDILAEKAEV